MYTVLVRQLQSKIQTFSSEYKNGLLIHPVIQYQINKILSQTGTLLNNIQILTVISSISL